MTTTLEHADGMVHVEAVANGCNRIKVELNDRDTFMPDDSLETGYPVDLIEAIMHAKGPAWVCDEIRRDQDPQYAKIDMEYSILCFIPPEELMGKRLLDFGSGCGASTMHLASMFPETEIVGVELRPEFVDIARRRADLYGLERVRFLQSPSSSGLPKDIGQFDAIALNAVYEHLLPDERELLLPLLWSHLNDGSLLFLNQTPNRWYFIENHTTQLPLLNYLPDRLAHLYARKCSSCVPVDESWPSLLRRGIRGGTKSELMRILGGSSGKPVLVTPSRLGVRSEVGLWNRIHAGSHPSAKRKLKTLAIRTLGAFTGLSFVSSLSLAIRKEQ